MEKMSNDEILMTNQFPNDSMTKPAPGMDVVIRASSFVIPRNSLVIRAWTFVILFPLISPSFWGRFTKALRSATEVKLCA